MSTLILLPRLRIENANAVAGLTWGFPAITHFLGYMHALSRKLAVSHGLTLTGCSVICHQHQVHAYSSVRDYQFALTRNPLTREGKTASFNEEGRMHLTVSLLLECHGEILHGDQGKSALEAHLQSLCQTQRLAGGTVTGLGEVKVIPRPQTDAERRRLLFRLLPGYALIDRSPWLEEHHQNRLSQDPQATLLDAWLDFAALKIESQPRAANEASGDVPWSFVPKPQRGYLVPLMIGYQRISECFAPGDVANARDTRTPFAYVEPVYGVGEWRGLHRIHSLDEMFWRYRTTDTGYYCCGVMPAEETTSQDDEFNYE
ncbi:type I-F CRISPR-associated protein Csy2 [Franconibacter daqui]|uniref:Type I-F CRISPR-associated protein Csy2 n=1 Tax=Franconibacter daqui TaxID=2047724 RepID=A0ABV1PTI1_9ENTR